ncbi:MAG: hypothetical protein R2865_10350 [Deinococcales bacterium]
MIKLLFATIAAGGGHVASAKAMMQALETHYPRQFEMEMSDYMLAVGDVDFDRQHKDSWRWALKYPLSARLGQRLIDFLPQVSINIQRQLLKPFAKLAYQDLLNRGEARPQLIISNHGLVTTGLALAKKHHGEAIPPVLTFATETHNISAYWADNWADHILVPNEGIWRILKNMGVEAKRMSITGYPVQQAFLKASLKSEARKALDLEGQGLFCLISLGGEGIGHAPDSLISRVC